MCLGVAIAYPVSFSWSNSRLCPTHLLSLWKQPHYLQNPASSSVEVRKKISFFTVLCCLFKCQLNRLFANREKNKIQTAFYFKHGALSCRAKHMPRRGRTLVAPGFPNFCIDRAFEWCFFGAFI